MRLPNPLVFGTAAAFLASGPARAEKPRSAAPAPASAAAPAAPSDGRPAPPSATGNVPATAPSDAPAPHPADGDAPAAPPPEAAGSAAGTPSGNAPAPTTASPLSGPGVPVVPSASVRRRSSVSTAAPTGAAVTGDDAEDVRPVRDTVGGHFAVGVDAGMVLPFGSVASGAPQSRTMGVGLSLGGDVAYGLSRTVMLGVYVDVGLPDARGAAVNESISTIAAGPLIRYHLVQGTRFDPWVSGGLGYRRTSQGNTTFTGVDWARLSLGGDWYPAPNVGFGPIIELSLGTFFAESPGTLSTKSLNAHFVAGLRVVFDGPGK